VSTDYTLYWENGESDRLLSDQGVNKSAVSRKLRRPPLKPGKKDTPMQTLSPRDQKLLDALNRNPALKARMEGLIEVVENAGDDIIKAADAEQRVIEELRQMGNDAITAWANKRVEKCTAPVSEGGVVPYVKSGKKTVIGTRPTEKST